MATKSRLKPHWKPHPKILDVARPHALRSPGVADPPVVTGPGGDFLRAPGSEELNEWSALICALVVLMFCLLAFLLYLLSGAKIYGH